MVCKTGKPSNPNAKQTSKLARRVAEDLRQAGWRLERLLSDNGNEFKGEFTKTTEQLKAGHPRIHAGAPADQWQRRGALQDNPRRVLAACLRPLHAPSPEQPAA